MAITATITGPVTTTYSDSTSTIVTNAYTVTFAFASSLPTRPPISVSAPPYGNSFSSNIRGSAPVAYDEWLYEFLKIRGGYFFGAQNNNLQKGIHPCAAGSHYLGAIHKFTRWTSQNSYGLYRDGERTLVEFYGDAVIPDSAAGPAYDTAFLFQLPANVLTLISGMLNVDPTFAIASDRGISFVASAMPDDWVEQPAYPIFDARAWRIMTPKLHKADAATSKNIGATALMPPNEIEALYTEPMANFPFFLSAIIGASVLWGTNEIRETPAPSTAPPMFTDVIPFFSGGSHSVRAKGGTANVAILCYGFDADLQSTGTWTETFTIPFCYNNGTNDVYAGIGVITPTPPANTRYIRVMNDTNFETECDTQGVTTQFIPIPSIDGSFMPGAVCA